MVTLTMDETQWAKESIRDKIRALPDSQLMRVDEVADMLLDLQQELTNIFTSQLETTS